VLHGAQMLLARLVAWARARQARVASFTLTMQHEPRHRGGDDTPASTALEIALAEASNDITHLQVLLRERLGRLPLPAPTLELRLDCHDVVQRGAPNSELFPSRASEQEGLTRLLERLQARLGSEQVQAIRRVADHRPECATVMQPLGAAVAAEPELLTAPHLLPHLTRPVWLLQAPQGLQTQRLLPLLEGRPLQLLAGPERIEAGWWDGAAAARDYFVAQAHDGALVWVFRSRLPEETAGEGWFLHGRFA
jgi:protein ImuB